MTKQIVHVARNQIASNTKHNTDEPVLIIRGNHKSTRVRGVELVDTATGKVMGHFVYQPHKPLACGARAWLSLDTNTMFAREIS